jgi:hypothetical protein
MDLDPPARDGDAIDDEAKELLAFLEIEPIDASSDPTGEVGDALVHPVLGGQVMALGDEAVALAGEGGGAGVDFASASLHLGKIEKPGLVEVGEPTSFPDAGVELAFQTSELGVQQFVGGGRGGTGHGSLPGSENIRAQQGETNLIEHELIEGIGANVALGATVAFAAGAKRVVIAAPVVAVDGGVAAPHLVTVGADAARAAHHEAPQ